MRLSFKWLCELVDLSEPIPSEQIASYLTMAGLEIEPVEGELEAYQVKVTPNRPDALCHIGLARELAAVTRNRLKPMAMGCKELGASVHDAVQVAVEAKEACPRYACRIIENIKVEPSPSWLQDRLIACGMRPVNNVVDVTNWILLECGQPLHAFDYDLLTKERGRANLKVRMAVAGEQLKTLDGIQRTLSVTDLVVTDSEKILALAGVMGGENSHVTDLTTNVLLEAAYFEPSVIRKTAKNQQIRTEASYRFERGVDPNGVVAALDRAADWIARVSGGRVRREIVDVYPKKIEPVEISLRRKRLLELSGLPEAELDEGLVRNLFLSLGIETVSRNEDSIRVRVPTFRPDLTREIDLIEEVMRLVGFDKVPSRHLFAKSAVTNASASLRAKLEDTLHNSLLSAGFFEAQNYSFGAPSFYKRFSGPESEHIMVTNPFGEETSAMRQSLLPGLYQNVLSNFNRSIFDLRLFETGAVFLGQNPSGSKPNISLLAESGDQDTWAFERQYLGGIMTGMSRPRHVSDTGGEVDFYDAKGVVEEIFRKFHLLDSWLVGRVQFSQNKTKSETWHPGKSAQIWMTLNDTKQLLGTVGHLHPKILKQDGIERAIWAFELDLSLLLSALTFDWPKASLRTKYPSVARDFALVVDEKVDAESIGAYFFNRAQLKAVLEECRVFDVYRGEKIPKSKKSIALALVLRASDRTLVEEEVTAMLDPILEQLRDDLGATLR